MGKASSRKRAIWSLLLLGLLAGYAIKNASPSLQRYREAKDNIFGTTVMVDVCYAPEQEANLKPLYQDVWAFVEDIHWRMSIFNDISDVAKVNRSYGRPVTIGQDTYDLIKRSFDFTRNSGGVFDITVLPLIQVWKKMAKENRFPSKEEIRRAQEAMGEKNIEFRPGYQVQTRHPDTKIDLGGIAVGYSLDELIKIFQKYGFKNFFVDAGGDIYVGGKNCFGKSWRIGVKDPVDKSKIIDVVLLQDSGITTSGDYEQHYEIQGERFSHIMNPVTGYPRNAMLSSTVIAPTGTEADVLAKVVCLLDARTGLEFINHLGPGYACVSLEKLKDGRILKHESREYLKLKQR